VRFDDGCNYWRPVATIPEFVTLVLALTESESQVHVEDHGEFVSAVFPNGITQTLSWSDIIRFEIQTNDSGPFGWDVWFVLISTQDEVFFPLGATGEDAVLARLASVTGGTFGQLIDGMNCGTNCTFVTWEKEPTN